MRPYSIMKRLLLCVLSVFVVNPVFCEPRNVLLITVDTLRADYLSCNGSSKVQTPNLDRLSKDGVNFTQARTPVPLTLPAHASILTGFYPPSHGVRDNGTYRLAGKQLTLAEVMKKHGYITAAFVASFVLDHRFGLNQGFDVYDDKISMNALQQEDLEAERNGEAIYKSFAQWLEGNREQKPFFVWIHLYDPHTPYDPPEPYRTKYSGNRYAGEVAYSDAIVGKIIQLFEHRKLLSNSMIAVVADHGEGLGDHNELTHSVLIYNSTLHVPMMIYAPGLIRQGTQVSSLSRTIDLAPTLLDYAGIQEKLGEGTSLRSAIEKKDPGTELVAYSESLYPRLNLGWSELYGLESGKNHFILAPRSELYDTQNDLAEMNNLISQLQGPARQFQQKLEIIVAKNSKAQASTASSMDEEAKEKLASLGYVSGSPVPAPTGVDPKDKMQVWNEIQVGLSEFKDKDYQTAIKALEKIRISDKGILLVYDYLGSCYMALKQWPQAQRIYTEALQRGHDSSGVYMNLGISYYEMKQYSRAQQELEKAVAIDDQNVSAHYYLGNALRAQSQLEKAVEQYKRALQINPRFVYAANGLGMTYAALKMDDTALQYFKEAVKLDSENTPGYFNLAVQLDRMGRSKEALDAYQKFLQRPVAKVFEQERLIAMEAIKRLQR